MLLDLIQPSLLLFSPSEEDKLQTRRVVSPINTQVGFQYVFTRDVNAFRPTALLIQWIF